MKKAVSILFLSIFLYNIAGYYVVFKILQRENREQMSEQCAAKTNGDLAVLRIADSDAGALRRHGDGEFEYQGRLYDISHSSRRNDTTYYYCVNDTEEETLIAGVNEHIKDHTGEAGDQSRESKIALKNITRDYYFNNTASLFTRKSEKRLTFENDLFRFFVRPDVPTPPPKA